MCQRFVGLSIDRPRLTLCVSRCKRNQAPGQSILDVAPHVVVLQAGIYLAYYEVNLRRRVDFFVS